MRLSRSDIDEAFGRGFAWCNENPTPRRTGEGSELKPLGKAGIPARRESGLIEPLDRRRRGVELLHFRSERLGGTLAHQSPDLIAHFGKDPAAAGKNPPAI